MTEGPEPIPREQLLSTVGEFFKRCSTMSLATIDPEGRPHAANLYFAADQAVNLHFVSDPASAHCRDLEARPDVAATVYEPVASWRDIRGVQLRGLAAPIGDDEWDAVWRLYVDRFPDVEAMAPIVRRQRFYRVAPTWLRWIDNTVGFGFKRELAFEGRGRGREGGDRTANDARGVGDG